VYVKSELYSTENMYEKMYKTVEEIVVNKTDNVHINVKLGQIQATTVAVGMQSILHIVRVCL